MAIGYIKRVAGPFTGAGTTSLPFGFLVYKPQDVYVALAESETAEATNLEYGTDYTVVLNADQETTPGGTVTLVTALTAGQVAAVGSALDYTQPTQLTNFSRFPPEIINDALDRIVILIQQLLERLDRTVTLPVTSSQTPEELVESLQKAAESAEKVASAYAAQAGTSATSAASSADLAQQWAIKTDGKVQDTDYSAKHYALAAKDTADKLPAKGQELEAKLTAHTDTQIARIDDKTDDTLVVNATGCAEKAWTLTADVAANTEITIPGDVYYCVGRHHLRVGYNGLQCYIGTKFVEVGNADTKSNKFKLLFDAKAGDELSAWVAALGKADADMVAKAAASAAEAKASADLSKSYADEAKETLSQVTDAGTEQIDAVKAEGDKQVALAKAEVATAKGYADSAKEDSDNASVYAHSASESAKTAAEEATTATDKAKEAATSATSAKGLANNAAVSATEAKASAQSASGAAKGATVNAGLAQKWATQTDSPVEGTLYGAKYYAERAAAGQIQADWSETDTKALSFIQNKPTIPTVPTNVSAFENDAGYLTEHQSLDAYATKAELSAVASIDYAEIFNNGL